MVKIRRKKLFEDDVQQQQPAQQTGQQPQQQTTTQQPAQTGTQPQQNQQTTTTQPQQNGQQQQQQQNGQQQQNQQQNGQQHNQQNGQQQQQENKYAQKVLDVLKKMENTYWIMSVNLPEEIQKEIPDFKQGNQLADPIIKLWNDFKNAPDENKFNAFVDSFKNFGNPPQDASTNQQQVNAGLKAAYSFNKRLMDNLNTAKQKQYYNSIVEDYFDKTEFTLY